MSDLPVPGDLQAGLTAGTVVSEPITSGPDAPPGGACPHSAPAGAGVVDSPLRKLDELTFWAVFLLACALVSPPVSRLAAAAGIVLIGVSYYRAGLARSPDAPDDVGFTRFFLGATLVVYAVSAATGWELGLWFLMLSGMFLIHCARNLMIVEKVLTIPAAQPAPAPEPMETRELFDALDAALAEAVRERVAADVEPEALQTSAARAKELSRRHFLLTQRGALYLGGPGLKNLSSIEKDLAAAEAERDGSSELSQRDVRARKAASLRRILEAARKSHEDVARFRNALEAAEDALAQLEDDLKAEDWTDDVPQWLTTALEVLDTALSRAEEDLARLESERPREVTTP
ncbi:MAG: hypothetical protein HYY25_05425 [Candidatus Wallbacteria bacterium]|nr:hypothetical protein [Candidatus Wallbacteria bacterium]